MLKGYNLMPKLPHDSSLPSFETPIRPVMADDHPEIASWYRAHDQKMVPIDLLPPQGLIWPGVAAGFMMKTDSKVCFLEHYIANPRAFKEVSRRALELITDQFLQASRAQGYVAVFALTNHPGIERLTQLFNFTKTTDHALWVLKR
jgi:hypothetical protein